MRGYRYFVKPKKSEHESETIKHPDGRQDVIIKVGTLNVNEKTKEGKEAKRVIEEKIIPELAKRIVIATIIEISSGVDTGGAGEQGIMKGYAVRETHNLMPLEYELARSLCQFLYEQFPYDGKTQITLNEYQEIKAIVASFQNVEKKVLENAVLDWLTNKVGGIAKHSNPFNLHCNPAGDWSIGGFDADTGLTGRKLMVDNYGPRYAIGGGAFSGKDATKVDRSGAYMARKIAVDILKERPNANEVMVEIAYAIGVAKPVAVYATVDGVKEEIDSKYDLTPKGIIDTLGLREPQYESTAEWGHFGRGFRWE